MRCVKTTWFTVLLNGSLEEFFPNQKGLSQGDSISPLLFVLTMEYLSRYLAELMLTTFKFYKGCKDVKLNHHLCFADDLFLFNNRDVGSVKALTDALKHFEKVSGLRVNGNKSFVYLARVDRGTKGQIFAVAKL